MTGIEWFASIILPAMIAGGVWGAIWWSERKPTRR